MASTAGRAIAVSRRDRWERKVANALLRALRSQAARTAGQVRSLTAAMPPDPLDGWGDELDNLVESAVIEVMADVAAAARRLAGGASGSIPTPDLRPYVADIMSHAAGLGDELRAQLTDALYDGAVAGLGSDQLASIVQDTFAASEWRADAIARTSVVGATNAATDDAMGAVNDAGVALTKTWLSAGDERVRESHAEADGQVVAYDEAFEVGADLLDFPGDPNGSPEETIQCRCVALYEAEDGQTVDEASADDAA